MLDITYSNSFKKDLKKYKHKNDVLNELIKIIDILASEKHIPAKYKNHNLVGKFKQYKNVQELEITLTLKNVSIEKEQHICISN